MGRDNAVSLRGSNVASHVRCHAWGKARESTVSDLIAALQQQPTPLRRQTELSLDWLTHTIHKRLEDKGHALLPGGDTRKPFGQFPTCQALQ
ncbi:hypothetical protein D9M71_628600 [compost metagenome]